MKYFLAAFFLIGCSAISANAQMPNPVLTLPKISFISEFHDFGVVPQGKPVSYIFSFVNSGQQPLTLSNVVANCPCLTADWTRGSINPGAPGTIKVVFNAAAAGPITKTVIITSNGNPPNAILTVTGTVKALVAANSTPLKQ